MTEVLTIKANTEVLGFYHKQKSEFHFQEKTDNEFLMFLLDTAVRVISIGKMHFHRLRVHVRFGACRATLGYSYFGFSCLW